MRSVPLYYLFLFQLFFLNRDAIAQHADTIRTESGLQYVIIHKTQGRAVVKGDIVSVLYRAWNDSGIVFDSSTAEPLVFRAGIGKVIRGWDEALALMKEGEKAILVVPPHLAYGEKGSSNGSVPPGATLRFEIELLKVAEGPLPYTTGGLKGYKTPEGLRYYVIQENLAGTQAYSGSTVSVHYTGYLEDGTIFDSSLPGSPYTFRLGDNSTIAGWEVGIRLMKSGDKLRLVVPPKLAYRDKGVPGLIPPGATLIFDVELIDVQ